MEEIAGLDSYRLRWIYGRERADNGSLVRKAGGLPDWVKVDSQGFRIIENPQPFVKMFGRICKDVWGMSRDQTVSTWEDWKQENPDFERKRNY